MGFDRELARAVVRGRDRDTARFFAGRASEIQRFDDALADLEQRDEHDRAAEFVVYRGAPGCGKTSLVNHLRGERRDEALFIGIELEHLASSDALNARILEQANEAGSMGSKLGAKVAEAVASKMRLRTLGEDLARRAAIRVAQGTRIVLHLDEAQEVGRSERLGLLKLHTTGLPVPSVFLLTGLHHTTQSLGRIGGLSRLSSNAVVNMGVMAEDECVESTLTMLDALDVDGTEAERARAAASVGALSHGWPQHLRGAQRVLCAELDRTGGALGKRNAAWMRQESDRNRHAYYAGRLDHPVLSDNLRFSASLVARVDEQRPSSVTALRQLCREARQRSAWTDLPAPDELATALIEKGAVTTTEDGGCEVPIPSMADWARALAGDAPS